TVALSQSVHAEVRLGGGSIRLSALDRDERVSLPSFAGLTYDGRLDRHKAALNMLPVTGGLELITTRDLSGAAGLAADAAATVATLAALARCRRESYAPAEIAGLAVALERDELHFAGNPLDAWAVSLGGALHLRAAASEVEATAVVEDPSTVARLLGYLVVLPLSRGLAGGVCGACVARALAAGDRAIAGAVETLENLVAPVAAAIASAAPERLREVFQRAWGAQRQLDPVLGAAPMRELEGLLEQAGAWAWKLTAGEEGGCLVVLCDPAHRARVEAAARSAGCVPVTAVLGDGLRVWEEVEP
ncbi:MAG TPA: hypothetical protein VNL18_16140, partial [Gemmatimonadales bacterium]|nr:hypothetical protein [Gemmatimonadales bacterium]